ncbi:MAG: ketol-acid reductoisomerase [Chloroflexi bacterium]|nr:ketol-acid reductoisomerase [Chloroflexota bacterium]
MTVLYHEDDGDLSVLAGRQVAVIGYDGLGQSFALNLRDSGIPIIVGVDERAQANAAAEDGLRAATIVDAVTDAQIILLLLPDENMAQIYIERVAPHLERGDTLVFASGYNVAFGFIEAPPFVDVGLIAPRTLAAAVRERYLSEQGFYSLVAVGQDASRRTWPTVLALAKAVGSLKAGAIEVSIEQEAELDLFVQQAILPAFHHLMTTAANLLLKMGYPAEAALSDLYISGEFTDYLRQASAKGLLHALQQTSLTNQYGTMSRMERFNDLKLERLMEITLEEIRRGGFAKEWAREYSTNSPRLKKLQKIQAEMDLWELEQQTLEMLGRAVK